MQHDQPVRLSDLERRIRIDPSFIKARTNAPTAHTGQSPRVVAAPSVAL